MTVSRIYMTIYDYIKFRTKRKTRRLSEFRKAALAVFFIFFFFCAPALSSGESVIAGDLEIVGLHSIGQDEFINLLGFKKGMAVNEDMVRKGIKRAFLKGIFEDISIDVSDGADHRITVSVEEREFIKKVQIKGNYQLSSKKITGLFLMKEDRLLRYDLIPLAKEELKKTLALYGFPEALIEVEVAKDKEPYRANVNVTIDAGKPLAIKALRIVGTGLDIRDSLKTKPGDVYDQSRLNDDLKQLAERLKKEGYYKPAVGPYSYHEGELEIAVSPGKKLTVAMEGNNAISEKDLMKEVPFFPTETFSDEAISEAIAKMVFIYREAGYASAQIAPVIKSDEETIHITFFIFEGGKYSIKSLDFIGASLPHEKLQEVMNLKKGGIYNPDILEKDRDALKEIYGALGYIEAGVKEFETNIDEKDNTVGITVDIHEGQRTEILDVDIAGVETDAKEKLMKIVGLKQGDPYNEVDISDARFKILDYYSEQGYANVDVTVARNIEGHKVSIKFDVMKGTRKLIGKAIITGNKATRYVVIKRELTNSEGEPYSFRTLANDRQKLYKLGLFTNVDIEALSRGEDTEDILISVKEGNAGAFEFGVGYGEYEQYRGFIQLSYRNLWGMNRQGSLRAEISGLEKRVILQYYEPWFMGHELPFRVLLLREQKKEINIPGGDTIYKLVRHTASAGFEKQVSPKVKADIYYEFSVVKTYDVQPDVILSREDVGTLVISSIKSSVTYDTRDNPFDPTSGLLTGISVKAASPLLLSETFFNKFEAYGSFFHKLHKRVVLAVSVRGGLAFGLGSTDELPIVERFFLGGGTTVRGYEQDTLGPKGDDDNPIGGNAFLEGNLELRTAIGRGFSLVPFLDMGNVWIKAKDMDVTHLKYTAGMGLRYDTPVGPLRVDFGFKLNRRPDESRGALHFSIGHAF
jgi:outer membrane protein insertion porin family